MIKILPTGSGIEIINGTDTVPLSILNLGKGKIQEIAEEINSLKDGSGNKVAFLTQSGGKVTFFKHSPCRDEAIYIQNVSPQLLNDLKYIEIEIARLKDELFDFEQ